MADPGPVPDPRPMDEATIDCTFCGGDGALEIALERLDDSAEWRRTGHWVICKRHTPDLNSGLWLGLAHTERLVVMAL